MNLNNLLYMWWYKTEVGIFKIIKNKFGYYDLWIDDEILGSYHSPWSAADDVYLQSTGHYEWDDLDPVTDPTDLSEWNRRTK